MAITSTLENPSPVIVPGIPVAADRKPVAGFRNLTIFLAALLQETELVEEALRGHRSGRNGPFPYAAGRIVARRTVVAATGIGRTCASMVSRVTNRTQNSLDRDFPELSPTALCDMLPSSRSPQ